MKAFVLSLEWLTTDRGDWVEHVCWELSEVECETN